MAEETKTGQQVSKSGASSLAPAKEKSKNTPMRKFLTIGLPILVLFIAIGIVLGVYFGVFYNSNGGGPPPSPPGLSTPTFVLWAEPIVVPPELPWCLQTSIRVAKVGTNNWTAWSTPQSSLIGSMPRWRVAGLTSTQEVKFERRTGTGSTGSEVALERLGDTDMFTDTDNPCPGMLSEPVFRGFTATSTNETWNCAVSYVAALSETGPWTSPLVVQPASGTPNANPRFEVNGLLPTDTLYWQRRVGSTGPFADVIMTPGATADVFIDNTAGPCQGSGPNPPPPPPDREVNVPVSELGRTFYINQNENFFYFATLPQGGRIKIGDLLAQLETAFMETGRRDNGSGNSVLFPLHPKFTLDATTGFVRTSVPIGPGFPEASLMRASYATVAPGIKPPTVPAQTGALNSILGYQILTSTRYVLASVGEPATQIPNYIPL